MSQKSALISGITLGIGREIAIVLAQKGYRIFGVAPENALWEANDLVAEYDIEVFACDISDFKQVKSIATIIGQKVNGRLDILYNNAGVAYGCPAIELPEKEIDRLFRVNVFGHMYMTKYFSPYVIAAKGTIVFTSSVAARAPLSWMSAYCATKAAIDQYALVLHGEMKPYGVRVHSVITGGVDTGICDSIPANVLNGPYYSGDVVYDSLYASQQMSRDVNISPRKYAKEVVSKITSFFDPGFNTYRGARAYLLHLLSRYIPLFLLERGIAYHFRQSRVFSEIRRKAAELRRGHAAN